MSAPPPLGLYLHVPFCARKCPYCDFNTYAGLDGLVAPYVAALCAEIARRGRAAAAAWPDRPITTVFLGGGTPTVLSAGQLGAILAAVRDAFTLHPRAEVTSEANPGAIDRSTFAALRDLGVNRLSLGVQSFEPAELAWLERIHDADEAARAVAAARAAGFDNINLDLMFGLPGQTEASWAASLERAVGLAPEHLSLYGLIVEPATPLYARIQTGAQAPPDEDEAATQWEVAQARLAAAGYVHYEVSNWARDDRPAPAAALDAREPEAAACAAPAFAARHNLVYWRNEEWLACGAGAHGHRRAARPGGPRATVSVRWGNVRPVPGYIGRVRAGADLAAEREHVEGAAAMGETMMVGLRLVTEGVPHARFARHHGVDPRIVYADILARLAREGLATVDEIRTRLTPRGLAFGNRVFERFVAD